MPLPRSVGKVELFASEFSIYDNDRKGDAYPATLDSLVTARLLDAVPLDLCSGTAYIYH